MPEGGAGISDRTAAAGRPVTDPVIAAIRAREGRLYRRFNQRGKFALVIALYLNAALIVIHLIAGATVTFSLLNLLMVLSAIMISYLESEMLIFFLATNATWVFSFSAYIYSTIHFNVADQNLWGASDSIQVVMIYNVGCNLAYFLFRLIVHNRVSYQRGDDAYKRALALGSFKDGMLLFGIALQLVNALVGNPTVSAVASQFSTLLWLGLAFDFVRKGGFRFDIKSALFVALFALIAAGSNGRTILILVIFFIVLSWIYYSNRLFKINYLIIGFVAINLLSLFSEVAIDLRINHRENDANRSIVNFFSELFDPENLVTLIYPLTKSKASMNVEATAERLNTNNLFALKYYSGYNSMSSRYVALPMLDVVCGRISATEKVDWHSLGNLAMSVLPNVGQEKDLIYSDRVTWAMGLRDYGNIGRPEITNACELYTMSGWLGLLVITLIEFLCTFLLLERLKKVLVLPSIWIAVIPQILVWMTVATTALSTVAVVTRSIPFTIVMVWILYAVANAMRAVAIPRHIARATGPTLKPD